MPYAAGTCKRCGASHESNGEPLSASRCRECRRARREADAALREYRRENGQCLTCGAPVARSKLVPVGGDGHGGEHRREREPARYCREHLAYYAARQRGV
jgi:hypothetical protein